MSNGSALRAFVIVALLMPGLVMASPIAGACGRCGNGEVCPMAENVKAETEAHSCCDSGLPEPAPALATSSCECGREAPPAAAVEVAPTHDPAAVNEIRQETSSTLEPKSPSLSTLARPPAPPPTPPVYLIDCAFLT